LVDIEGNWDKMVATAEKYEAAKATKTYQPQQQRPNKMPHTTRHVETHTSQRTTQKVLQQPRMTKPYKPTNYRELNPSQKNKLTKDKKCFFCEKPGHLAKDCRKRNSLSSAHMNVNDSSASAATKLSRDTKDKKRMVPVTQVQKGSVLVE